MADCKIHPFFKTEISAQSSRCTIFTAELIIYNITWYYTVPLNHSIHPCFQDMQITYTFFHKCIQLVHVIYLLTYF